MTGFCLTRLQIEGFRGINNAGSPLDLRFRADAVNSVFAANAFGKSSIYEALAYALRGEVHKLANLPAADTPAEYYCNLFHPSRRAQIGLTFAADDGSGAVAVTVERMADGTRKVLSPSGHPDPEGFLAELDSDLVLLDHRTFLDFVYDSPLQRGRSFAALLGLAKLSELRQVLEVLAHSRNTETDFGLTQLTDAVAQQDASAAEAMARVRSAHDKLLGPVPDGPIDVGKAAAEATGILAKQPLVKRHFAKEDILTVDFSDVKNTIREAEKSKERARLAQLIQTIEGLKARSAPKEEGVNRTRLERWIKARDKALELTRGPLTKQLYEFALAVLHSDEWLSKTQCPVCELRPEYGLADELTARLGQYRRVERCQEKIRNRIARSTWLRRLHDLEEDAALGIPKGERRYDTLYERLHGDDVSLVAVSAAFDRLEDLDKKRVAALAGLEQARKKIAESLPKSLVSLTEQVEYAQQIAVGAETHEKAIAEAAKNKRKLALRKGWKAFIEYAARAFGAAEVRLSTEKTNALETSYRGFYEKITNNPDVVPVLQKATGSQELHLRLAKFYDRKNVSANALLAESYRNALALSMFLAAALHTKSKARFIVFDDVTSSLDAGFQYTFMELIRRQFSRPEAPDGPQVIILSHDGLLEKYFDMLSGTTAWHHQRLEGQSPTGFVFAQPQDQDRLRGVIVDHLDAGRVKAAEAPMRQYLEYRLMEVIRKVRIRVPVDFAVRDDRRMVGNCRDAIMDAVALHERGGDLVLEPAQVKNLRDILWPAILANWLVHYETGSIASFAPTVLKSVLDAIDQFADCFRYTCTCGGGAQRRFYRDLTRKACGC